MSHLNNNTNGLTRNFSYSALDHPLHLCCPITLSLFEDPVLLAGDGCTYERNAIESHLSFVQRSPSTNLDLNISGCKLIKNYAIISVIDRYTHELQRNHHLIQHHFMSPDPTLFKSALHLKIQLLGDCAVGKTTIKKYLEFDEIRATVPTIAYEISSIQLKQRVKNEIIQITILDISGGFDIYHSMVHNSYRGIHGAILVCSLDDDGSVKNLENIWWSELQEYGPESIGGLVIVNKCDLLQSTDIVLLNNYKKVLQDAKDFASHIGWQLYTTSAVTGEYIHVAVKDLVDRLLAMPDVWESIIEKKGKRNPNFFKDSGSQSKTNSGGCCMKGHM